MNDDTKAFCEELGQRFPDLASLLAEHLTDNDEILPYVFMGDVTRYILSDGPFRKQLVSHLDKSLRESASVVQELIAVSFVENLEDAKELERALKDVSGEAIRYEWHRQQFM